MCKRCQYKIYGKEKRLATYHEKLKKTAIKNCRQCGIESHKKTGYKNGYCHKCATSINNKKRTTGITIVCPVCSVEFWVQQNKIQKYQKGEMKYGLFCSKKCYGRYCKENIVGDRNPNWKGGAVGYYGPNWNQQRKLCRKRANYQCQNCGKTQEENKKALDVHHIKPIRTFNYIPDENDNYLLANDLSNLVALCKACHLLLEPR